jgi:hypothetical protein
MALALLGWYAGYINFWLLTIISIIPSITSTYYYSKKNLEKQQATKNAIRIALSLFAFSIVALFYFFILNL